MNGIETRDNVAIIRTFTAYGVIATALVIFAITKRVLFSKKTIKLKEKQEKEYKKIGGLYTVFMVTLGIMILNAINTFSAINPLEQIGLKTMFYIQNIVTLIAIAIIFFFIIMKKNEKTPKKIEIALWIMGIINILSSIIRICISLGDTQTFYTTQYYLQEAITILGNFAYMIIWTTYFATSKRIHVYYRIPFKDK